MKMLNTNIKFVHYFKDFVKILKQKSVNRNKINWKNFKKKYFAKIKECKTQDDLLQILKISLKELKDKHSYLVEASKLSNLKETKRSDKKERFKSKLINKKWGYLFVSEFSGFNSKEESTSFSQKIQNSIKSIDDKNPKGWIIDLRKNTGGNMWPMLCALGPFFSQKKIGTFIFPNNRKANWYYDKGKAREEKKVYAEVKNKGYELKNQNLPIAILISSKTMSSGEAVAVAFHSQKKVRFFGQPTSGRTTCNKGFKLKDGSLLFLAIGNFANRQGKIFKGKIIPDRFIKEKENIIKVVMEWLQSNSL